MDKFHSKIVDKFHEKSDLELKYAIIDEKII